MPKRSGETAMRHARAWIEKAFPGDPVVEAKPRLSWQFVDGRRIPRTVAEDIFGAFDLVVHHLRTGGCTYVQVTTWSRKGHGGSAADRRKKVRDNFLDRFPGARNVGEKRVKVIAWVAGKHFLHWYWSPTMQTWVKGLPILSPEIKRRASS